MPNRTPLEKLQQRWRKKTGEDMPEAIAQLPISRVLTAVEMTEDGQTVFVPAALPRTVAVRDEGSMMDWDRHGELT
jgi:hypothetical protein